ncbi:hypothetical protein predicted by Glimmer/Critica [Streptococcus dysgalactiae subsp. equisimilis AC-2713]|uniref:Uncharacterized protein n=1 Tax=Streptococcus dysgalactiae subsp. equisimilis AC-2713 TaxID=759913 RepID=A0AB33R895_STREQ|nr:hypothetical protein SDE12394_10275 [Streptococcus dysgalactiae subsp. equisimilis ATCC 12394]EGL49342.1 hypothetical protein HMPREF9964_1459 [Streptococcus dysgalactiae subsp. equisimilis SK1249]EGR87347.1 conserved domain protein [Streptococcus dysgalactiae subsp. equisimilis SK1250]CCI63608.1 hypothetical protein predicted by Glimmer/Critica [Streptococcus dysgalactiae subsp. equisimilis AC-2713]
MKDLALDTFESPFQTELLSTQKGWEQFPAWLFQAMFSNFF